MLRSILFVSLLTPLACRTTADSGSDAKAFYSNSKRRAAGAADVAALAKVNGCAAFFVENSSGSPLVATAKHCMDEDPLGWCASGVVRSEATGQSAKCKRVVAWKDTLDIVLIELDAAIANSALSLASFVPQAGTRLKMVGYPGDPYASGGAMVTENCWMRTNAVSSPHVDTLDTSAVYNCSVYGGNSGGPITIESTSIAVGMPYTYDKGEFHNVDHADDSVKDYVALLRDFVNTFSAKLAQYGVAVVKVQASRGQAGEYLAVGRCKSSDATDQPIYLTPEYNTGSRIKKLHVVFEKSGYEERYPCVEDVCLSVEDSDSFRILTARDVEYTSTSNARLLYDCPGKASSE